LFFVLLSNSALADVIMMQCKGMHGVQGNTRMSQVTDTLVLDNEKMTLEVMGKTYPVETSSSLYVHHVPVDMPQRVGTHIELDRYKLTIRYIAPWAQDETRLSLFDGDCTISERKI
jgi:hypothetical protein